LVDSTYLDALRAIAQPMRAAGMPRSLAPTRRLLAELGNPQLEFPAIVVTGSVGKGTTCHQIAELLHSAGAGEVGLFTGPHLHSFRERFGIDDEPISQAEFIQCGAEVQALVSHLDDAYTTFEMATALALVWFAGQGVDIAVLEVGIGGRWDAVNAVKNVLAVFTPIESEHIVMLGGSLQTIAWHKAGIIQPDGHAISYPQSTEVQDVLRDVAEGQGASLAFVEPEQLPRAACHTLIDADIISLPSFPEAVNLLPLSLPGRLEEREIAGRSLLIDGGHTPASARYLLEKIADLVGASEPVLMVIGMLRDKSARDFMTVFDSPRFHIILTQAPSHRAFSPEELAARAGLRYASVQIIPDLNAALIQLQIASERLVVVAGSLRMAAAAREAFGLLSPEELDEAQATRAIFEGDDYLSRLRRFG
jgi:dihydrofolate synthase/folylpolyglutamate synthase